MRPTRGKAPDMAMVHGGRLVAQALKRHGTRTSSRSAEVTSRRSTTAASTRGFASSTCATSRPPATRPTAGRASPAARRLRRHRRPGRHRRRHRGRQRAARRDPDGRHRRRRAEGPLRHGLAPGHGSRRAHATRSRSGACRSPRRGASTSTSTPRSAWRRRTSRAGLPRDAARLLMNFADERAKAAARRRRPLAEPPRPPGDPRASSSAPPSCCSRRSARSSSWARRFAGRRGREAVAPRGRRVRGAVLPQRHGARRPALRAHRGSSRARGKLRAVAGRRRLRLRDAVRLPRRLRARADVEPPAAKIVQVDLDGAELGRNRRVDVAIHGDSGIVLEQLVAMRRGEAEGAVVRVARVRARRRGQAARQDARRDRVERRRRRTRSASAPSSASDSGPNDIVIGDGGDFVATAAYVLKLEWPQLWMDPGPLGTLGVGPGYAMAAKLARPDARVVLVYGDGSFGLHAHRVRGDGAAEDPRRRGHRQRRRRGPRSAAARWRSTARTRAVATALEYTRYEKVVEACGGGGFWVEHIEELGPGARRGLRERRPGVRQRSNREERFPQGRDQRLSRGPRGHGTRAPRHRATQGPRPRPRRPRPSACTVIAARAARGALPSSRSSA